MKIILANKFVDVLLVFKVSRLLRVGYKGFEFVQESVVEEGLRAVSVSQGIDTNDGTWRALMYLHGLMDDLLLDTIADHCRAGLQTLFMQGFTTGALPVGYERADVPGAPLTNNKLPRTRPQVDEEVAQLIRDHYEMIAGGMPIAEGWRRWLADDGPCDPRATTGAMSSSAYRRMLSNPRYVGLWAFGKKRNQWSNKRDGNRQIDQPDSEVKILRSEELRIVSDELYLAVQAQLAKHKRGPRARRAEKPRHLWDLTTGLFICGTCSTTESPVRFYQTGSRGLWMRCKQGHLCPAISSVHREEVVRAVCRKLQGLIRNNADFVKEVIAKAEVASAEGNPDFILLMDKERAAVRTLSNRLDDLHELLGTGTDDDRRELKAKIRAVQADRNVRRHELERLEAISADQAKPMTADDVQRSLDDICSLLDDAASGKLGDDLVYKALSVFERLVGGQIVVHVERRPGRKRTNVRGVFRPDLIGAVNTATGIPGAAEATTEVDVWLREPPFLDRWAHRAYELFDLEGHSYRSAAKIIQAEVHAAGLNTLVNSGNTWLLRKRYFEMLGQPAPARAYNNGRPRKAM